MPKKNSCVEDNRELSDLLFLHLSDQSWRVTLPMTGQPVEKASDGSYDLVVLDIMLPGMDGLEVLKALRSRGLVMPVLMLHLQILGDRPYPGPGAGSGRLYHQTLFHPGTHRTNQGRIPPDGKPLRHEGESSGACHPGCRTGHRSRKKTGPGKRTPGRPYGKGVDLLYFSPVIPGGSSTGPSCWNKSGAYGHDGYGHTVNANINRLRAKIETDPPPPLISSRSGGWAINSRKRERLMFNSLYAKIAAGLAASFWWSAWSLSGSQYSQQTMYRQEVNQKLNAGLAGQIVKERILMERAG